MNKPTVYFPELDSLRFIAFLLVLFHHSPYPESIKLWKTLHDYGWVGVDLFLCLSAYLFTKLLLLEHRENGDINIGFFYLRRIFRIWPLYFFFFTLMFLYSIFINGTQTQILFRALGMVTFTDNLLTMWNGYNFAIAFSAHLWTISYEEQFYLFIPWLLRLFYRLSNTTIFYYLGITILFGVFIRVVFIANKFAYLSIWTFPLTHFESMLGGIIVGLGLFNEIIRRIPNWLIFIIGMTSLWLVTLLPNITATQWGLLLTYPLVGTGMSLILAATIKGELGFLSTLFKNKKLGYLGKISYGMYVYHLVAQEFSSSIVNRFMAPEFSIAYFGVHILFTLITTILISMVSYHFLESPFLKIKNRFALIYSRPI